jgi:hypothetical protein
MRKFLMGLALSAVAVSPATAAITVGAFVAKAQALRANPLAALTSSDFALLRSEAQAATSQLKAEREARKAAGKPPIACIPPGTSIGPTEMVDGLAALPRADQRLPLKEGYAKVLARKYPCR